MKKYYWVNSETLNQHELDLSANQIARLAIAAYHPNRGMFEQLRKCILDISMHCLADIRGNYFWPEFHREVSMRVSEGAGRPTEDQLTKFCRDVLRHTDWDELSDLQNNEVHNRFIALIFEQAGIGKDRNKIIRQFLEWIVKYRSSIAADGSGSRIDISIGQYKATVSENARRDIGLLENVLSRIASELLSLVDAFERHPDRLDMIEWSWSDLCLWWMEKTGNDLNELTPSAASVLMEWISRLSCIWTKAEIFRLSRMGSVSCIWPDGRTCSSFKHHSELPLGNATLRRGAEAEHIVVVDSRNTPTEKGLIDASGKGRGGLHFFHKFKWRSGKLFLLMGNIRAAREDGDGYTLTLGGKKLWQGEIKNGICMGGRSRFLDVSQLDVVSGNQLNAELSRHGGLLESRKIEVWPLNHDSFLVSSGNIFQPSETILKHVSPGGNNIGISLVTGCGDSEITLTNISEISRNEWLFSHKSVTEIKLGRNSQGNAIIRSGKLKWNIDFRTIPDFSYPPDSELSYNGISFSGSGNVRVVGESSDIIIKCPDIFHDEIFEGNFGLWMVFDGIECFARVDHDAVVHEGSELAVNVLLLAKNSGINLSTGIFEITPGIPDCRFGKSFRFFIPSGSAKIQTSSIDEFSAVSIRISNDTSIIRSAEEIAISDIESARFCHGTITGPDWQVGLRWKPSIFDVLVNGLSGCHSNYIYPLLSIDDSTQSEALFITPYFPDECNRALKMNGRSFPAVSGAKFDLYSEVITELSSSRDSTVMLSLECQNKNISWKIDAAPVVRSMCLKKVFRTEGVLLVTLDLDVVSLAATEIKLVVRDEFRGSNAIAMRTTPHTSRISSETLRYTFSMDANGPEDHEIHAYDAVNEKLIFSECRKFPTDENYANDADILKKNINNLIDAYRETGSYRILEEIFFLYLRAVSDKSIQVNSRGISTRLGTGLNPEEEKASMLALKLVDAAVSGSDVQVRLPALHVLPKGMALQLASIWLMLSGRYASRGVLVPEEFLEAFKIVGSGCLKNTDNDRVSEMASLSLYYAYSVVKNLGIEVINNGICLSDVSDIDFNSDLSVFLRQACSEFDLYVGNLNG